MIKTGAKQKALGSKGKGAEEAVKKFLTALSNQVASFEFERVYDARSAGGRFPSRTGDFHFYRAFNYAPAVGGPGVKETWHGVIEVKEVDHAFRLPAKNFKKGALAKLRKRQWSGGLIVILVKHTPKGLWRLVPFKFLDDRLTDPSWDLQDFSPCADIEDALCSMSSTDEIRKVLVR